MGSGASTSSATPALDFPDAPPKDGKRRSSSRGRKSTMVIKGQEIITNNEVAPIIIKNFKEEYQQCRRLTSGEIDCLGQIRENMPLHHLVLGKYFMVKDHFGGIDELNTVKHFGAPNVRAPGGYPVYGMGQPTEVGLRRVLENLQSNGHSDIIIVNIREEPILFLRNSQDATPYTPRMGDKLSENISTEGMSVEKISELEVKIRKEIVDNATEGNGKFYFYDDVEDLTDEPHSYEIKYEEDISITEEIYSHAVFSLRKGRYIRMPMANNGFFDEKDIDTLLGVLKENGKLFEREDPSLPVLVFNSQVGMGRTAVGLALGCLILAYKRGFPQDVLKPERKINEKNPNYEKGEYNIIQQLINLFPRGVRAKHEVDIIIDFVGDLENIRLEIYESKKKLEAIQDDYQIDGYSAKEYFHNKAVNYLECYFYLIAFNLYLQEQFSTVFNMPFSQWMLQRPHLYRLLSHIDISERKTTPDLITTGVRSLVSDQYDGLDVLSSYADVNVSNYRKVPGLPLYGCAQPSREGLTQVITFLKEKRRHPNIVWFNLREDITLHCDGKTYSVREKADLHMPINLNGISGEEIEEKELHFKSELQKHKKPLEVHFDLSGNTESVDFESILTIKDIVEQQSKQTSTLRYHRLPMTDNGAPEEKIFDYVVSTMKEMNDLFSDEDGPALIFSCADGNQRCTMAMAIAGLLIWHKKGFPYGCKPGEQERVSLPNAEYTKGEFIIVMRLIRKLPNGVQVKREVDLVLDKCSETMTPMHYHIREVIFSNCSKMKNAKSEEKMNSYKKESILALEKYLYLILFNAYLHTERSNQWNIPFSQWLIEAGEKIGVYEILNDMKFTDFSEFGETRHSKARWRWKVLQPSNFYRGKFV